MASGRPSLALAAFWRARAAKPQSPPGGWWRTWTRSGISARGCCEHGPMAMRVVIFGGTGFVGVNLADTLLARGHEVTLYDRAQLPTAAQQSLAEHGERLSVVQGDITDKKRIEALIAKGYDAIVLGAAITAGAHLERTARNSILQINVMAQLPILGAAIRHRVRRVINLSSAAAYGVSGQRYP